LSGRLSFNQPGLHRAVFYSLTSEKVSNYFEVISFDRNLTGCCPNENLFERSLKRFLLINLGEVKEKRFQLFEPKGEFWDRLERALDLSKNVSEPVKNDLGNSPLTFEQRTLNRSTPE
jgi:coenzyme F420-reducing hydrogenase gamma subunit